MKRVNPMSAQIATLGRLLLVVVPCVVMGACGTTMRVENARTTTTGILAGEGVVIMPRSYHLGNETEEKFINCVSASVGGGSSSLRVIPNHEFVDALFPWFEPRTAPAEIKELSVFMSRPGVAEKISEKGVRYVVWIDGDTDKVASGGSMSCAVGFTMWTASPWG